MGFDPYAAAGLDAQTYAGLVGPQDGYTVLSVTQTQMGDGRGGVVDGLDIAIQVGGHPGVFTYSAPLGTGGGGGGGTLTIDPATATPASVQAGLQALYGGAAPLAGVAGLAQTIEALYAL